MVEPPLIYWKKVDDYVIREKGCNDNLRIVEIVSSLNKPSNYF